MMAMGSSILLYFFIAKDQIVNTYEGIILFIIVVAYTYFLIDNARKDAKEKKAQDLEKSQEEQIPSLSKNELIKQIIFIVLGAFGLYLGSEWFVDGAKGIAQEFGVDETLIGLTIVALGTSLPELVASSMAAFKKESDLAIGNLLGSSIFNILSILGITSIIKTVNVPSIILERDIFWMLGITLLILPMMLYKRKIARWEGGILLVVYASYIYVLAQSV